jgi:hypothetical protein
MSKMGNWQAIFWRTSIAAGISLLAAFVPLGAQADHSTTPSCNALVSVADNLYLVDPAGKILVQFTKDGVRKKYATISPDGSKVAYVVPDVRGNVSTYTVINVHGVGNSFPIDPPSRNDGEALGGDNTEIAGALMGMSWSTDNILRLTKHISPSASRFEFRRINEDLTAPARLVGPVRFGDDCALRHDGRIEVACVHGGDITLGSGLNKGIFYESPFEGLAPMASFQISKGQITTTTDDPVFTLEVRDISERYGVNLRVTPPSGAWSGGYIKQGEFTAITIYPNAYAFFATVVDTASGVVRVDEVKANISDGTTGLDPALVWRSNGRGLLAIRRMKRNQATLYLIQPHGKPGQWKWGLAATAPIDISPVTAMRLATPSLLLFRSRSIAGQQKFNEVPIHFGEGRAEHTKHALTLGSTTLLPTTILTTLNGTSADGEVLDWSCDLRPRDHRHDTE